ncbi:hypothetical protein [Streptomyces sp. NRRL WC-3742]|uniref:hypothetical protein n=1 Tax=Streptomyces sp. NRRL WC-3742 TaxID=1463934 RepID=UPI0004C94925|nr:hypothetical protein [Streptomyces sp. NRRL WC-3742]
MKIAARGALLVATSLLTVVAPIAGSSAAGSAAPVTDATCVMNGHGVFASAVDPGGVNVPLPDTLAMTGTVSCVDAAGAPLADGTFTRTVTMPATECTGDEHQDTSTTTVNWTGGTASTFRFDRTDVVKVNGTASLVVTGGVTADSARFAGDTVNAIGTSTGVGCGTPAGETALDSTLVLRLTH